MNDKTKHKAKHKAKSKPKSKPKSKSQDAPQVAPQTDGRTWIEEIEVSADKLMDKIKELAAETSVRRVRVKEPDGDIAVDIPLTVGAVAGGVVILAAPILALIGALAAFFAKVTIEIVREEPKEDPEKGGS